MRLRRWDRLRHPAPAVPSTLAAPAYPRCQTHRNRPYRTVRTANRHHACRIALLVTRAQIRKPHSASLAARGVLASRTFVRLPAPETLQDSGTAAIRWLVDVSGLSFRPLSRLARWRKPNGYFRAILR